MEMFTKQREILLFLEFWNSFVLSFIFDFFYKRILAKCKNGYKQFCQWLNKTEIAFVSLWKFNQNLWGRRRYLWSRASFRKISIWSFFFQRLSEQWHWNFRPKDRVLPWITTEFSCHHLEIDRRVTSKQISNLSKQNNLWRRVWKTFWWKDDNFLG